MFNLFIQLLSNSAQGSVDFLNPRPLSLLAVIQQIFLMIIWPGTLPHLMVSFLIIRLPDIFDFLSYIFYPGGAEPKRVAPGGMVSP